MPVNYVPPRIAAARDWESVPERSKGGSRKVKSKGSSPKVGKEDTTSIQLCLFDLATPRTSVPSSFMPEFQAALKSLTLTNKLSFLSLITPTRKSSQISAVDSISSEKVFKPYWTEFSQTLADLLSLPTKIGFVALASILSHGSVVGSKLKYWFSTLATSAQKSKWWKIFSQSSMSSVVDFFVEDALTKLREIQSGDITQ